MSSPKKPKNVYIFSKEKYMKVMQVKNFVKNSWTDDVDGCEVVFKGKDIWSTTVGSSGLRFNIHKNWCELRRSK